MEQPGRRVGAKDSHGIGGPAYYAIVMALEPTELDRPSSCSLGDLRVERALAM